jgi:hypothetical protein
MHNIEANAFQLPSLDFEEQQKSFHIGLSFEGVSDFQPLRSVSLLPTDLALRRRLQHRRLTWI